MSIRFHLRAAVIVITSLSYSTTLFARSTPTKSSASKSAAAAKITETAAAKKKLTKHSPRPLAKSAKAKTKKRTRYYEHFYTSSFSTDNTEGDVTAGEDPIVRAAAIDALGNMNGTVVAIEPTSGRVLAMVNQKLALSSGAQPCSTIKLSVALAALSENLITKETPVPLSRRYRLN